MPFTSEHGGSHAPARTRKAVSPPPPQRLVAHGLRWWCKSGWPRALAIAASHGHGGAGGAVGPVGDAGRGGAARGGTFATEWRHRAVTFVSSWEVWDVVNRL